MEAKQKRESYGLRTWIGLAGLTLAAMMTAVCVGSVNISVRDCLQVFKAALSGTTLTLTELTTDQTVTKNNAVILKSTASPIVMTLTSTASGNDFSSNSLEGVSAAAGLTAADPSTTYVLNYTAANGVGFYKLTSGYTLGVGKAYLTYSGALAPEFLFFEEDSATSIDNAQLTIDNESGAIFNLSGQRIQKMHRGINIVNGNKVIK